VSFELESDEALRQVLERCLRQQPGERATPREFREALLQALGDPAGLQAPVAAVAAPVPPATPWPTAPEPVAGFASAVSSPLPPPAPMPPPAPEAVGAVTSSGALPALDLPPLGDEPSPEGDVLQSVDDEVLNALLSVPPPPPRTAGQVAAGAGAKVVPFLKRKQAAALPAAGAAHQAGPATATPWFRQPVVLGAITGVIVLALIAAIAGAVWYLRRPQQVAAVAAPAPKFVAKVFTKPPVAQLEEATLALASGDDLKARRTLRAVSFGEQGLLPLAGCRGLDAVEETLARIGFERLPSDLQTGLKNQDLEVLRNAVEAGGGQEAGMTPDVRANFDRAKGIVDAYAQAIAAAAQGNRVQVLERFANLHSLLPKISDPEDLRGKAATALETEAEGLIKDAKYDDAFSRLEPVERTWPDRPGLKERVAKYRAYQQNESQQEALLAAVPNIERHKKPTEGLEAMSTIEPTPHLAPRFAAARKQLEDQLVTLDKEPPVVELRDGFLLEYSRGAVVELSFRATDDYQVKDVKLMARVQGGKMRELPFQKTRTGYYTVQIPPAFHQNETIEFYVVATDLSGHVGNYGSAEKPRQIKRRQGFKF